MPLTPNNRNEAWMKGMVDGSTTLEPNNRREHWYKEIVDAIGSGGGGGGASVLVVGFNTEIMGALNKTWKEIHDAALSMPVISVLDYGDTITQQSLYQVGYDGENYFVEFEGNYQFPVFSTADENGYPVAQG